jgi:hypothetical protein
LVSESDYKSDSLVLFIEPDLAFFSPEREGQAGIVIMHKHDFVRGDFYRFEVLASGDLWAIEDLYHKLEGHSMAEVKEAT